MVEDNIFSCAAKKDNDLFLTSEEFNSVFSINLEKNTIDVWDKIPEENFFTKRAYSQILLFDNKLLLVPFNAKKIWIYDFYLKAWDNVDCGMYNENSRYKFSCAYEFEGYIYLFGYSQPKILKICKEDKLCYEISLEKEMMGKNVTREGLFNDNYVFVDNYIFLPVLCSNQVFRINLKTDEYDFLSVGIESNDRVIGLTKYNEELWLISQNGVVIKWNNKSDNKEKYALSEKYDLKDYNVEGIKRIGDTCKVMAYANCTLDIDLNVFGEYSINDNDIIFLRNLDNDSYVYQLCDGELIYVNGEDTLKLSTFVAKQKILSVAKQQSKKYDIIENRLINEERFFTLEDYLNCL